MKEKDKIFSLDRFGSKTFSEEKSCTSTREQAVCWDTAQDRQKCQLSTDSGPEEIFVPVGFEAQYSAGVALLQLLDLLSFVVSATEPHSLRAFCSCDLIFSVQQGCKGGFMLTRSKATMSDCELLKANQALSQQKPQLTGRCCTSNREMWHSAPG